MYVTELLASKGHDVATISKERSVADAVAILKEHAIGALVVTGANAPLVGIISERDVVRALAIHADQALTLRVSDLMTADVTTCGLSTTVTELMGLMTAQRVRHIPVVDESQLVGMVSIGDVVKARLQELEHDKQELLEYVQAR